MTKLAQGALDLHSKRSQVDLARLADRAGLPPGEAKRVLEDGRYADTVRASQALWLEREIHAVPNFIFNDKYQVPGAQEAETFVRLLNRLAEQA